MGSSAPKRTRRQRRLIIAANRLPVHRVVSENAVRYEPSSGGLVSAMLPVLSRRPCVWIGWSGDTGRAPREIGSSRLRLSAVPVSEHELDGFYHGFSNRTIWPLYHDCIRPPTFDAKWWEPYVAVNRRYAAAIARHARGHDPVWIHDYHLQLVPHMLRKLRRKTRIGFFMHIPFPPEELFSWLPWRRELLEGLLGADVIGFQTQADAQNFSRVARRFNPAYGTDTELRFEGRNIKVRAFPISIDFRSFEEIARRTEVVERAKEIRRRIGTGRKLILSVDRLDYTKGIDQRLLAFENLLDRRIAKVDDCVLIQIAIPSRERVREYVDIRTRVERIVGRINGEHSSPGRVAVHYFRRSVSREELVAYYLAADVMLVTPLRDGMNLVAKEYVAARTDNSGVLVLSEFAGAARELRQALMVNAHDVEDIAAGLAKALTLSKKEARQRMIVLRTVLRRHDVNYWAKEFVSALWS